MVEISLKSGGLPYRCIIALLNIDEFITIYKMYNRPKSAYTHQNESNMNERNLSEKFFMEGYSCLQMKSDPFLKYVDYLIQAYIFLKVQQCRLFTKLKEVVSTITSTINDHYPVICVMLWYSKVMRHYSDVIMTTIASQITSLTVVYSTIYSDADQRKQQSSASLDFMWGIHRDRWIPRTNGQLRGKCFHLITSSCDTGNGKISAG